MPDTTVAHQPPVRGPSTRQRLITLIQDAAIHVERGYEDHLGQEDSEALADALMANGFDHHAGSAVRFFGNCA